MSPIVIASNVPTPAPVTFVKAIRYSYAYGLSPNTLVSQAALSADILEASVIAFAAGAFLRLVFLVTLADFADESLASNAFMYTTSSASSKGFLTSLILSLNISLAVAKSSVIVVPDNVQKHF